jgi:hypothetical protein
MPKVRDYTAELKALEERARGLKAHSHLALLPACDPLRFC